jgi:hypothetical protein
MHHRCLSIALALVLLGACGCGDATNPDSGGDTPAPTDPNSVRLGIHHQLSGETLALGTGYTVDGATYTFDTIRYWVTAIRLQSADGDWYAVPSAYYLVEQTPSATRLNVDIADVPDGDYTALSYDIGVDSEHNHNLDMFEGELEAGIDMDWGWNSGFIFLRIEGTLSGGTTFRYHIGTDDNLRTVQHTLATPVTVGSAPTVVGIDVDLASLFTSFDAAAYPSITFVPADKATEVIENFVGGHGLTSP